MHTDSQFVTDLRQAFLRGCTPTELIRRIAARHQGEPHPDKIVRDYFRLAFGLPMVRIGPEQVRQIAAGIPMPELTAILVPLIIRSRSEWNDSQDDGNWLDRLPLSHLAVDPARIPELASSWAIMDGEARAYVERLLRTAGSLLAEKQMLSALLEELQNQPTTAVDAA